MYARAIMRKKITLYKYGIIIQIKEGEENMSNITNYSDFIANLQNAGLKTTSIREGKEANFADYGNALSSDLQQQILDSFDCEQDYILQQEIASLFTGKNYINSGNFKSACKQLGLSVEVSYQKTSYIPDYKNGNFSNSVSNGSIAVYTISDGMGGEIKIADANGNGALETEELFMNQILGDINSEIGKIEPSGVANIEASSESNPLSSEKEEEKITQTDFNKEVEKSMKKGKEEFEAVFDACLKLGVMMSYTGTYQMAEDEEFATLL